VLAGPEKRTSFCFCREFDSQRDSRGATIRDHVDALGVVPTSGYARSNVRTVLMVRGNDFDWSPENWTEIFCRHLR
jgi:hypothetical protein